VSLIIVLKKIEASVQTSIAAVFLRVYYHKKSHSDATEESNSQLFVCKHQ